MTQTQTTTCLFVANKQEPTDQVHTLNTMLTELMMMQSSYPIHHPHSHIHMCHTFISKECDYTHPPLLALFHTWNVYTQLTLIYWGNQFCCSNLFMPHCHTHPASIHQLTAAGQSCSPASIWGWHWHLLG